MQLRSLSQILHLFILGVNIQLRRSLVEFVGNVFFRRISRNVLKFNDKTMLYIFETLVGHKENVAVAVVHLNFGTRQEVRTERQVRHKIALDIPLALDGIAD